MIRGLNTINPWYSFKTRLILAIASIHLIFSLALFWISNPTSMAYNRAVIEMVPASPITLNTQCYLQRALMQPFININWRSLQSPLGWGVVLGGLSGAISCWTTERLLSPLTEIVTAAERIERGEEIKILAVSGVDELARLRSAVRNLASTLNEKKLSLKTLETELEQRELSQIEIFKQLHQELEEYRQANAALAQENQELQQLSMVDALTEVANRRSFNHHFDKEWRRSVREKTPLSLILCDIDYFKAYNDTYGHQAGDTCLKRVAQAIRFSVKRPADLVARYGGEEFVVVLPNTNKIGALYVAQEIREAIRALQIPHNGTVSHQITLSFGVATTIPVLSSSNTELIATADQRLYQAKQERNSIFG